MLPTVTRNVFQTGAAHAGSCALAVLLLAPASGGPGCAGAQASPVSVTGTATIVRVQQVEPRRVLRCDSPVPPVPNAPRAPVPPEVAAAAAAAATAGTPTRPPGPNPRGVAAATAAALIAADAIQQPPPATNVAAPRNCVATLVPAVTQWRVEYFLAGRYHRAWFAEKPAPDLTLAELLRATEAPPR